MPCARVSLAEKSFLSGLAALLVDRHDSFDAICCARFEWIRVPRPLLLVIQFLYRYLFVISEQAQHMRSGGAHAAAEPAKRDFKRRRGGAIGVLFARSWERADGIYQAMLARGFSGRFPAFRQLRFGAADAVFLFAADSC